MAGLSPCFDCLAVMDDRELRSGPVNMAIDEVLLDGVHDLPVLRFYRWLEPTVSFGYFEPIQSARLLAGGREIVRRATGGGLVEHGDDLTYTLAVPRSDPFVKRRPAESYRLVHAAVADALVHCGLEPGSHQDDRENISLPGGGLNACFQRPVLHDLTADGRKIAGGAQRRTRAGLLHQGSIFLGGIKALERTTWNAEVRRILPLTLARCCVEQPLSVEKASRAEKLASTKYATTAWTDRL